MTNSISRSNLTYLGITASIIVTGFLIKRISKPETLQRAKEITRKTLTIFSALATSYYGNVLSKTPDYFILGTTLEIIGSGMLLQLFLRNLDLNFLDKKVDLKKPPEFIENLTEDCRKWSDEKRNTPLVLDCDEEIDNIITKITTEGENNCVMVLGETGTGKSDRIKELNRRITLGQIPILAGKEILSFSFTSILAGTHYRGKLEGKIEQLKAYCKKNPNKYILFVDEGHQISQKVKGPTIGDQLKPFLTEGIPVIAATTKKEFEEHIQRRDPALARRFKPIYLKAYTDVQVKGILERQKNDRFEKKYNLIVSNEAIDKAITIAKAIALAAKNDNIITPTIDLLHDACSKKRRTHLETPPQLGAVPVLLPTVGADDVISPGIEIPVVQPAPVPQNHTVTFEQLQNLFRNGFNWGRVYQHRLVESTLGNIATEAYNQGRQEQSNLDTIELISLLSPARQ